MILLCDRIVRTLPLNESAHTILDSHVLSAMCGPDFAPVMYIEIEFVYS
jgi:hypothetical protein